MKRTLLAVVMLFNVALAFAQTGKSVLWKVTGKNITQPVYLVGTIHLYDTLKYDLPKPIFDRLTEVKRAYFELDFGHIDASQMMKSLWITDSTQFLNRSLDTAALRKLKQFAAASPTLTSMRNKLYEIKPVFVSAFLMTGKNITSIDMELFKKAVSLKDSVGGLETVEEQLRAINTMPIKEQIKGLTAMLNGHASTDDMLTELTRVYVKQDIDHILEDLSKAAPLDANSSLELVGKRNINMADRIDGLMGNGNIMVAVGAAHLGGKAGVIMLLRKKGYKLTPITFTFQKRQ